MLDLTSIKKPTLTVKISETESIELKPASKGLIERIASMGRTLDDIYRTAADILSENTQKRVFTEEEVAAYDIYAVTAIIEAYLKFAKGLRALPN